MQQVTLLFFLKKCLIFSTEQKANFNLLNRKKDSLGKQGSG